MTTMMIVELCVQITKHATAFNFLMAFLLTLVATIVACIHGKTRNLKKLMPFLVVVTGFSYLWLAFSGVCYAIFSIMGISLK